jgi:hypothetical protein
MTLTSNGTTSHYISGQSSADPGSRKRNVGIEYIRSTIQRIKYQGGAAKMIVEDNKESLANLKFRATVPIPIQSLAAHKAQGSLSAAFLEVGR